MDKYKKYYGIMLFLAVALVSVVFAINVIKPQIDATQKSDSALKEKRTSFENKKAEQLRVSNKLQQLADSINSSQKKVYAPLEADLGNETLFFTLYNDLIEMVHANSVKIKAIDYSDNPESDKFVEYGKDVYYVCDVKMELVSNYVNLGKLIQDIYQYPYYIKINELEVKPYEKDKTILITNLSLRLYAHTSPQEEAAETADNVKPEIDLQ